MHEFSILVAMMMLSNPTYSLVMTGVKSSDRNTLSWGNVGWATSYTIQRKSGFNNFNDIYDTNELTFDDLEIENGSSHTYRVRFNGSNFNMYSNEIVL